LDPAVAGGGQKVGTRLEAHGLASRKTVIRGLDPRIHHFDLVIPGSALLGADPESSSVHRFWIPGSLAKRQN
jgi:hypothetical protein